MLELYSYLNQHIQIWASSPFHVSLTGTTETQTIVRLQNYTLVLREGTEGLWERHCCWREHHVTHLVYYQEQSSPAENDLRVFG